MLLIDVEYLLIVCYLSVAIYKHAKHSKCIQYIFTELQLMMALDDFEENSEC